MWGEWQGGIYRLKRKSAQRTEHHKIRFCTFLFIWKQQARYCLSNLKHILLEAPQMSGIIIELRYDRVLRGRISRVCTALGLGEGMHALLDTKWNYFIWPPCFLHVATHKAGLPQIRLPAPVTKLISIHAGSVVRNTASSGHVAEPTHVSEERAGAAMHARAWAARAWCRCFKGWAEILALACQRSSVVAITSLLKQSWESHLILSQSWFQWGFCLVDNHVEMMRVRLGKSWVFLDGWPAFIVGAVWGSVHSAGCVLPWQLKMDPEPRASWLWKGTVRNAVSYSDPHCSASLPHNIILRIEVHTRSSIQKLTHFGWFLSSFGHFFGLYFQRGTCQWCRFSPLCSVVTCLWKQAWSWPRCKWSTGNGLQMQR